MRKRLYGLALVVVLGGSFALAQSMPQPQRQTPSGGMPPGPAQGQTSNQSAVLRTQTEIQTALEREAAAASANVNILVTSTVVELTGTVPTQDDKVKVEQIAASHSNGLPVKNSLKVVASNPK